MIRTQSPPFPFLVAGGASLVAALLLATAPVGEVPLAVLALVLIAPVATVWRMADSDLQPVRPSLLVGGLVISCAALADIAFSSDDSSFAFSIAAAPAAAVLVCWAAASPRGRGLVLGGATVLLALLSLYALMLWARGTSTGVGADLGGEGFTRRIFPSSFGHPNQFAATLGMLLPLVLAAALAPLRWGQRLPLLAVTAGGLAAVGLTYSRNFWIAVALALVVVCLTSRLGLVVLAGAAAVVVALSPFIVTRFSTTDLAGGRVEIWESALTVIREHPFGGAGVGSFPVESGALTLPETADAAPHAHNLFLAAASELGIPVALALAVVVVGLLVALTRRVWRERDEPRPVATGCLGALVVLVLGGAFDAVVFHNTPTLMIAAGVVGLSATVTAGPPPSARSRVTTPERQPPGAAESGGQVPPAPEPPDSMSSTARNFALLGVAAIGNRLLALVLGLAIARGLGPSVYGVYTLAAAIVLVVVAVTDFGLQPYVTREVARDRERLDAGLRRLVGFRVALAAVGLVGIAGWLGVQPGSELAKAALILYLAMSLEAGFFMGAAYLQGLEIMRFEAGTALFGGLARTAGGVALVFLTGNLNLVLGWMAFVAFWQALAVTLRLRRERRDRRLRAFEAIPLGIALGSSGAMMVVVVSNALILRADSIVIGAFDGAESVGFYTAAYALVTGVQIIPWILSVAVFPVFSRTFGRDDEQLRSTWAGALRAAALTTIPAAVIVTVLAGPIIARLYGDSYAPSTSALEVLIWWVPLAAFTALSAGLLRAAGRERIHAVILVVGATANIVGNLLVVPSYGFVGAAWVTIAAEAGMGIATVFVVRRLSIQPPGAWLAARALVALAGLTVAALVLRPLPVELAVLGAVAVFAILAVALRTVTVTEIRSVARSFAGAARS